MPGGGAGAGGCGLASLGPVGRAAAHRTWVPAKPRTIFLTELKHHHFIEASVLS